MNIDPLAEVSRRYSPYAYALDNPVYFVDPDGMMAEAFAADGWVEEISEGETTLTFDASVNTVEEAKAAGYDNASAVHESVTVTDKAGEYSYSLDKTGNIANHNNESVNAQGNGIQTPNGTTIINNSELKETNKLLAAGGLASAAKEKTLTMGKELAESAGETLGKSGDNLLAATKFVGKALGVASLVTSAIDAYNNPTAGNMIKAAANIGLLFAPPGVSIVIGILDATGVTDKVYDYIGDGITGGKNNLRREKNNNGFILEF